jgi:flagellar hook-length control protein FliK
VTPAQASETALAPAVAMGAPHVTASPIHSGGVAAPSTPSTAPAAAGSFDVDDLAGSISRPLSDGNGTYTVTVALHPSELGHVQAVMSLAGNDLQVSLTAQTQTGHDALAHAADALKDQLARGGVNVNVTLRDHGSPAGGDEQYRPPAAPGGTGSFVADGAATEVPVSSGLVPSQIHLVL